ncbi:uncharacterized protein TRAVEDRAFT_137014 [Trametes versicolor FP-101664 SS1]|uniref:RNA polymerase III subunit C6 n=1 Tax=Trametes versicolor (strain FP-101664) TaxID=717944 RepID=R7S6X3_TRAVS|nr:uncharacterized protein TRAVEDRAFT_137014 [Trametes versicolor FP-101664 SS1]EIW51661.1 hypothetical protein TRAVEDRAFT_137014 [Trametes versicolor FP-101664 SS1]
MSTRKPNAIERKLHQAALAKTEKIVTPKELENLVPDANARLAAINFLLGTGLFVLLKGEQSQITYRAVSQEELSLKKGLDSEEGLVLDRIRTAGVEGIWTKHIKAKTQLHQTVVDRCLKSLTKRQLIKTVPDVRHPTRKTYILASLQPATELTGGPWYTDKELDTEFIKLLSDVCLKIVQDRSFPRVKERQETEHRPLYPCSHTAYATSQQHVQTFLQKSRVTETALTVEHVEMLLDVLVLDGKIEKIPAFHLSSWNADADSTGIEGSSTARTAGKRKRVELSSDESDEEQRKSATSSGRDTTRSNGLSSRPLSGDDADNSSHRRKKRKIEHSDHWPSDSERGSSPPPALPSEQNSGEVAHYGSGVVYRAIHEERISTLGINQTPCLRCPKFDFCSEQGSVNPKECAYYDPWLVVAPIVDVQS